MKASPYLLLRDRQARVEKTIKHKEFDSDLGTLEV